MVLEHEPEARRARATGRRRSGRGCSRAPDRQAGVDAEAAVGRAARRRACRRRARPARASRSGRGRRRRRPRRRRGAARRRRRSRARRRAARSGRRPTRAPAPACLAAFASASWTIRYAARSTPAGSARARPSTRSVDRQARRAGAAGERVDAARGSAARPGRASAARRAGRARPSASRGDRRRSARRSRAARSRVALDDAVGAAGLDRDHADVVRDGVVQLAGDAHPLARSRPRAPRGARPCSIARGARRAPGAVSGRLPRTTRPTVHGSATPPSSAATTPSG